MISRKEASSALKWAAINALASLVVKMSILVVLSRLLEPSDFGVYNVCMAFVLILSTIGQLGIPTNIVSSETLNPGTVSLSIIIGMFSAAVLSLLFCIALSIYDAVLLSKYLDLMFLFVILLTLQISVNILESLMKRVLNFRFLAVNELFASFIGNGILSAILALCGWQFTALAVGQIGYLFVKIIMLVIKNRSEFFRIPRIAQAVSLMDSAWPIMIAEAANMATVHMQRPMVAHGLGASAAGIWSRVYQIIVIQLAIVVQPLDSVTLPIFSRLRSEKEKFSESLVAAIQLVGLATLPISIITVVWTPLLVPILFGPSWSQLVIPLQIGSIIIFFRGIERVLLSISRAVGTMRTRAVIQTAQLILIVVILFPAMKYGLVVSSLAYVGALTLGFAVSLFFMNRAAGIEAMTVLIALAPGAFVASVPLALGVLVSALAEQPFGGAISIIVVTTTLAALAMIVVLNAERFLSPVLATALSAQLSRVHLMRTIAALVQFRSRKDN